jgi:hypothetical protein
LLQEEHRRRRVRQHGMILAVSQPAAYQQVAAHGR